MPRSADLYRAPTLILLFVLVAVFGALWLQRRSLPPLRVRAGESLSARRRQLLWLAGWMFAAIQLEMEVFGRSQSGIWLAVSRVSMQMGALMFLGSMAPQYMTRKPRVLYIVAFAAPVILFAVLISLDPQPQSLARAVLMVCVLATLLVALRWGFEKNLLPVWLSLLLVGLVGCGVIWLTWRQDYPAVLSLTQSGIMLITALLFVLAFRRLTAGVIFTVGGLTGWALPMLLEPLMGAALVPIVLLRAVNLMKVIAAVGMIVLVLEDEIASNKAAQLRDRRARLEMEKYTEIFLGAMPSDEDSGQYDPICEAIGGASRFSQAAVILRGPEGRFRLAGKAGMDGALTAALDALARRTTLDKVREIVQSKFYSQVIGHLALVDLTVLMEPGDELLQMNFREAHAVAIRGRDRELLGALLVAGLREAEAPLLTEDVLPLELLASRVGAAREQQMLLRRVFQAERLAGLGQLAGGMAHELNNPLTVVTGYAELMADNEGAVRDQAVVILNEARRMKQIIDSLVRFRKASPVNRESLSIEVVLRDIEKLLRPELERERVQCQMLIPQQLPEIRADGDQIRQVFLQVAKNAIASMDAANGDLDRRLIVEAAADSHCVQITFSDNGPGFKNPARAFDPFYTTREQGEGMGLGLSICYSIIREHGGEISAVNLLPRGAAVVIELPAAETPRQAQPFQVAKSTGESPWAPVAANGSARAI